MKNLGYELVTAEYTNSEYNIVRALWSDPKNPSNDAGEQILIETIIEAKDDDSQWLELLELTSINQIMEETYVNNNRRVEQFEQMVLPIAKKRGLVYDLEDGIDSNIYKAIVKALFSDFDPVDQKEQLFLLKMEFFNVDFIKNTKSRSLKKELRQAVDLLSTVEVACKIFRASQAAASKDTAG